MADERCVFPGGSRALSECPGSNGLYARSVRDASFEDDDLVPP